ncbi:MAG: hypothetical protein ACLR1R_05655 [Ruminococcus callidus]
MEKTGITITKRKDGRYVGKFIAEYADNGKAQYHYVYGKTYEEAESKVLIGREIATRYLSGQIYHCQQGVSGMAECCGKPCQGIYACQLPE